MGIHFETMKVYFIFALLLIIQDQVFGCYISTDQSPGFSFPRSKAPTFRLRSASEHAPDLPERFVNSLIGQDQRAREAEQQFNQDPDFRNLVDWSNGLRPP